MATEPVSSASAVGGIDLARHAPSMIPASAFQPGPYGPAFASGRDRSTTPRSRPQVPSSGPPQLLVPVAAAQPYGASDMASSSAALASQIQALSIAVAQNQPPNQDGEYAEPFSLLKQMDTSLREVATKWHKVIKSQINAWITQEDLRT
eukprot:11568679-Alexandrium_andersonii.AAC.1